MTIDGTKEQLRTVEQKISPPPIWWLLKALSVGGGVGGAFYTWRAASRLPKLSCLSAKAGALILATGAIAAAYCPYPVSEEEKKVAKEKMALHLYQLILHKDAREQETQEYAKRLSHVVPVLQFSEIKQASPQVNAQEIATLLDHFPHATLDLTGAPQDLLEGVCVMAMTQTDPRLCKAVRVMNWSSHLQNLSTNLEEFLAQFPFLEELNLYDMRAENVTQEMVEKILNDHPQLKKLELPVDARKKWLNEAIVAIHSGEELTPFQTAYLRAIAHLEINELLCVSYLDWTDAKIVQVLQKMPFLQQVNFSELKIDIAPLTLQQLLGLTSLHCLQLPPSWIAHAVLHIISEEGEINEKIHPICLLTKKLEPKFVQEHVKTSKHLCSVLKQFCNLTHVNLGGVELGKLVNVEVMRSIQKLKFLESLTITCGDIALGALPKGCRYLKLYNAFDVSGEGIALLLQNAPKELTFQIQDNTGKIPEWSKEKNNFLALSAQYNIKIYYLNVIGSGDEKNKGWDLIVDNYNQIFVTNSMLSDVELHLIAQKEEIL